MAIECPKCQFDNTPDSKFCKECGTQLIPVEGPQDSRTLTLENLPEGPTRGAIFAGRYEILEELGTGGMGSVYRVFDRKLEEEVALKFIRSEISANRKAIERFKNELKVARKITHKNVCKMYDLGESEGTSYITMEYVPGEDLRGFIHRAKQLTAATSVSIVRQVAEGLSEAHRLGVVHRDLKPGNIMIDKEGNARIMDFGIAHSLLGKGLTAEGAIVGTPEYMSPEQVEGKSADGRADIYALGIILFEMVTGRVPFEGDKPLDIAFHHKFTRPQNPKKINPLIPDGLSRIILKCLEKDIEGRYQTADELKKELSRLEEGMITGLQELPWRKRVDLNRIFASPRTKKAIAPAFVLIFLALFILFVRPLLFKKESAPILSGKPSLAVLYFENLSGSQDLDVWRIALPELIISDLTQSKYLNILSSDKIYSLLKKLDLLDVKKYSTENLQKVANEGEVEYILSGSFMKAGRSILLNFILHKPKTEEIIRSEKTQCQGEEELWGAVDEWTRVIKMDLRLSQKQIADDIDEQLGKITTSSPEAFKYYAEGQKYIAQGDFRQCIQFMEKAVTIDPQFAMAYRSLSVAYGNIGNSPKRLLYRQKTLEFIDRVSVRERLLIQAVSAKTKDERINPYRKLLNLYPDDITANANLGVIYLYLEEYDNAIECFRVVVEKKIEDVLSYSGLSDAYWRKGFHREAEKILLSYLDSFSDNWIIHKDIACRHIRLGEYDLSLDELNKTISLNPRDFESHMLSGNVYLLQGDYDKAEKVYQKLAAEKELSAQTLARSSLAAFYLQQGKSKKSREQVKEALELSKKRENKFWESTLLLDLAYEDFVSGNTEQSLKEADQAWTIASQEEPYFIRQIRALHLKGLNYVGLRSLKEAAQAAKDLEAIIPKNRKAERFFLHLKGITELEEANYVKAKEYLEKAVSLSPSEYYRSPDTDHLEHALFINSLGRAYEKLGELEKAQEQYEKIQRLSFGRLYYGDIYSKSFYRLATIYEQKGLREKAIEQYKMFLNLWKNSEIGVAEVEDARKRLTGL